jgi:hypothetical protein
MDKLYLKYPTSAIDISKGKEYKFINNFFLFDVIHQKLAIDYSE